MKLLRRPSAKVAAILLALALVGGAAYLRFIQQPHYHDSFAAGKTAEWRAFGGSWDFYEGAIRNNSDERGAKLVTGSSGWADYSVDADVLLLGQNGDAGVIVRASDVEEGVDSYSGYYVGLRDRNNTVAIGRADHGWMEYQAISVKQPIRPFHWYHLRVVAVGCEIAALASDPDTKEDTAVAMRETDCAQNGRIGLRSYSSGGLWKNVRVEPARLPDLMAIRQRANVTDSPELMQTETGFNSLLPYSNKSVGPADSSANTPTMDIHTPPLNSLRLVSDIQPARVTVRGRVVLTSPVLYIEDATGGIAVDATEAFSVKIGDEVAVTGTVDPRPVGVTLRNSTLRLLWSQGPAPPLSVTPSQAVAGAFDGMLIEIEGRLRAKNRVKGKSVVLDLQSGQQAFRALLQGAREDLLFDRLQPNSLLRLRGVCVADPVYTKNLTSFALLLRSSEDVGIIAGPPWWDKRQLVETAFVVMLLIVLAVFVYFRAEHWRMSAVVEERSRMAREIHDTLAQGFAGIALQLESALHGPPPDLDTEPVAMALHMARQSRREAHRSIAALRTLHTNEPLENMLRKVLRPQVAGTSLVLSVATAGVPQRLSGESESQLLRIAQEAVANVVQHAMASRVSILLTFAEQKLLMEITDDGCGFEITETPSSQDGHFGITGMRERAASVKGELIIDSGRPGTKVRLSVPITSDRKRFWKSVAPLVQQFGNPLKSWLSQ
jgi:hypothetical protein